MPYFAWGKILNGISKCSVKIECFEGWKVTAFLTEIDVSIATQPALFPQINKYDDDFLMTQIKSF